MPVTNRNQVNPLPFYVKPVHPSGLVSVNDGRITATRQFQLRWRDVHEFTQRMLGKFYQDGPVTLTMAQLLMRCCILFFPAKFPSDVYSLYATSVTVDINKSDVCEFVVSQLGEEEEEISTEIINLESLTEMERYYALSRPLGSDDDAMQLSRQLC